MNIYRELDRGEFLEIRQYDTPNLPTSYYLVASGEKVTDVTKDKSELETIIANTRKGKCEVVENTEIVSMEMLRERVSSGYYFSHGDKTFRADVFDAYDLHGNRKADALFRLAWEYGHSAGLYEVMVYLDDMVELIE